MDLKSLKIDRQPRTRRGARNPWPLRLGVLLVILGLGWVFWTPVRQFIDRINLPEVRAHLVSVSSQAEVASVAGTAANGYVVAARRAALSSDVPGRIVELNVREGSVVKRGQIVARLYSDEYRAAVGRARADHQAAGARVLRTKALLEERRAGLELARNAEATAQAEADAADAELEFADAELRRQQDLAAKGIGSGRELERARTDQSSRAAQARQRQSLHKNAQLATALAERQLRTAQQEVVVAEAEAAAAQAQQQQAQAALDKTDVRAPFDGVVVLKDAEVGEVVSPNVQGGSNARGAVCTMVDFASLEVQAHVPETSLASVVVGAPVDVFLDARPGERLPGRVDRIWPTADRSKATVEVRIVVEDRSQLRPEYGVRVVFRSGQSPKPVDASAREPQILIPDTAVVELAGKPCAFLIERDRVRVARLEVGERKRGRVRVRSGLRAGQRIVADPPLDLVDGDRIRILSN